MYESWGINHLGEGVENSLMVSNRLPPKHVASYSIWKGEQSTNLGLGCILEAASFKAPRAC